MNDSAVPVMRDDPTDTIVAVGDIMLGDSAACVGFGFRSRHPSGAGAAFSAIAGRLRGDIVLGNLECVLSDASPWRTRYRRDQMRGASHYANALRAAGFTALGVANNHAMQHGPAAFEATVRQLAGAGVASVGLRGSDGWCASPVVQTTAGGRRVGLLGYSFRPRQYDDAEPPYAEGTVEAVVRDVTRLRQLVDTVVVSLHWGEEFVAVPSEEESDAARRIIDAGATMLVGHHPHVVRPIERYRHGMICYSLGNLVSDMLWEPQLRRGAIVRCRLGGGDITAATALETHIDDRYHATPSAAERLISVGAAPTCTQVEYETLVRRTVRQQRFAAYRYAVRNFMRFPAGVLLELVASTARNKLHAGLARLRRTPMRANPPRRAAAALAPDVPSNPARP